MKLTPEEIDRLAAEKVMGWQVIPHEGRFDEEPWILPSNGATLIDPRRLADWSPSTDWGAAGEILDKMRADGYGPALRDDFGRKDNFGFWRWDQLSGCWRYKYSGLPLSPRAITIAALLAVSAITEEQVP